MKRTFLLVIPKRNGLRRACGGSRSQSSATARALSTKLSDQQPPPPPSPTESVCNGVAKRPIYVAATRQHVGKTSVSTALVSGLKKRVPNNIGFMKPVGQKSLPVWEDSLRSRRLVDKDVVLMREHFSLTHLPYQHMSPVLIPPGYTKKYLDGEISDLQQRDLILEAYDSIRRRSDLVLCEGTGHCAVGSIVGASNAKVASWLGASMVLIANGGLGSAFDELELNRVLCEHYDVPVAGVVINKVKPDKYERTRYYIEKACQDRWGIPLLGCVPDRGFLGCPCLNDLEKLFGQTLVSGRENRMRHYTVQDLNLVATSLGVFLEVVREKPTRTLYVCHSSRDDILLGFLNEYRRRTVTEKGENFQAAMIICEAGQLDPSVLSMVDLEDAPPILCVSESTQDTMQMIRSFTPKLNTDDESRVSSTVSHYEPHIDFDLLLKRTGHEDLVATYAKQIGDGVCAD